MSDNNSEIRVRFEIGEIKFEAEGSADLVERERSIFTNALLPSAVEAIVRTRGVAQETEYVEAVAQSVAMLPAKDNSLQENNTEFVPSTVDLTRISLAAFLKNYGVLSEQDFALFSAYFDEIKNQTNYFTKDDLEGYYLDARRTKPTNISMSLNRLAEKGLIMDATDVEQKTPKPYRISSMGFDYIKNYKNKEEKEKKPQKMRKPRSKSESEYVALNIDDLNLVNYPEISSLNGVTEKMMMVVYMVTIENKGEWFTVNDVVLLLKNKFGESITTRQAKGVFERNTKWFDSSKKDGSKEIQRKLLNGGKEYAKSLFFAKD